MRRRIFVATDDKASLPIFYSENADCVLISSKPDSLFPEAKLTPHGVSRLISISGIHTSEVFCGIKPIPPLHFLEISPTGIFESQYTKTTKAPTPEDIVKKHFRENPQKIGVISSDTEADSQLLDLIFSQNPAPSVTVFLSQNHDALKEFPILRQKLTFSDDSVLTALEYAVSACGMPYFCGYDFLISQILRRNLPKNMMLFTAFGGNLSVSGEIFKKLLHTPVAETMQSCDNFDFTPSTPQILADTLSIPSAQPFYDYPICHFDFARTPLRHILLSIIAKDTSPILAFFKRSALLRLCEGGFDLGIFECALTEYLIKLNIWFEKYHPVVL